LQAEALQVLDELAGMQALGITRLLAAGAAGDDIVFDNGAAIAVRLPLLRQQIVSTDTAPCLCLSDFVRPLGSGAEDIVGVFATTVDAAEWEQGEDDPYRKLLVQTLADRLAEAAAERMHEEVRRVQWGYAPEERLTAADLFAERYQGIRPAVGYPSLPDLSVIFLLDGLLPLSEIGVELSENGAMRPHASVCGLMMAHPQACYFSIGRISEEQLTDYAQRRGLSVEMVRRFLGGIAPYV
jgi:cobalamin-dependent methionine synthase I